MRRSISFITALCIMLFGSSIKSTAANINENIFLYGDSREIVVNGENISQEKMRSIADNIAANEDEDAASAVSYSLLCIFGHSLAYTTVTETTHNAYSTSPKCLVNVYDVEYCTRSSCDYISKEAVSSYRTSDCHG